MNRLNWFNDGLYWFYDWLGWFHDWLNNRLDWLNDRLDRLYNWLNWLNRFNRLWLFDVSYLACLVESNEAELSDSCLCLSSIKPDERVFLSERPYSFTFILLSIDLFKIGSEMFVSQ